MMKFSQRLAGGWSSYYLQFISHHTIHTDTTFDFFGSCRERRDSLPTPAHFLHLEAGRKGRKGRKRVAVTAATTTPRQRLSFELIVAHFFGFGIAGHEQLVLRSRRRIQHKRSQIRMMRV
jgi:hypothetical protein